MSISDSSQTDSDSCNSPQPAKADKLPVKNIIPKFAISSEEDRPTSPKGKPQFDLYSAACVFS